MNIMIKRIAITVEQIILLFRELSAIDNLKTDYDFQ